MSNKEWHREWRKNNPDKVKEIKRRFYEKHKEKIHAERRAYRAKNRKKLDAYKRSWEEANPDLVSIQRARSRIKKMNAKINGALRLHYGITIDAYNALAEKQGGVCAICGELNVTARSNRLVVDHNHKTGKLRGLLCFRCNCGLGYFRENHRFMTAAQEYLKYWDVESK